MIHYHMTLDEHRATRLMGYVDPDRYREGHRDYQPEMICRTGDGHAWKNSTRDWAKVTCPACLARKPDNDIERREIVTRARWKEGINVAVTGELLHMSNGEKWFHPYDGSQPIREAE